HGIDELRIDADAIAAPSDAAFQDVTCPELLSDLPHVDHLSLVLERGVPGDHQKLGKPRQLRDDVFGNAVAEILLLRAAARRWTAYRGRPTVGRRWGRPACDPSARRGSRTERPAP